MVATAVRFDRRLTRKAPFAGRRATSLVTPVSRIPAASETEVKAMLRDIAYVLHLTQKVKAEIVADRAAAVNVG